jgi:hypothetical protein
MLPPGYRGPEARRRVTVARVVSQELLEQLLAVGNESQSFEVKGPGDLSEKAFVARVARAVMSMGNHRDGGVVCVGIDEKQMQAMLPGLSPDQAVAWGDYDNVTAALAKYADPAVAFTLDSYVLGSGASVVVFDVAEFDTVPHVCKRTLSPVLQDGMTYVRPRGKPESVPVPNSAEMRALLDLATAKSVREFIRVARDAGVPLGQMKPVEQVSAEAYEAEKRDVWSYIAERPEDGSIGNALTKLSDYGRTDIAVRPSEFVVDRLRPGALLPFVTDNAVRLRGWPVPFVDHRQTVHQDATWVGQDLEATTVPHHEAWRMSTSGQFLHQRALATDLREAGDLRATAPGATGAVAVWDVLLYMVEVAEFGARMSTALDVPSLSFDVSLKGIAGRELVSGDWKRELHGPYVTPLNTMKASVIVDAGRLLGETRHVGVELTQLLLGQFGLNVPDQVLMDWQAQILDTDR